MKLLLLTVILLIGFSHQIQASQELFYIQWPWETFTQNAEITNGNFIKTLTDAVPITSYPAEILTSGCQWQIEIADLQPNSQVCMGVYALMNLNDLKLTPEADSTSKAAGICTDGNFLTSWGDAKRKGTFSAEKNSVFQFRYNPKFVEITTNGFNANFTLDRERAFVPWVQIQGKASVKTQTIFVPWAWTSPSEDTYVSGGLIQSNSEDVDKSVHAFFSQPLPEGARWRMTIDKYSTSGQICFGIYGKKYLGEFYEYPAQDLSKMGAAACSTGNTHNWWGVFDQKGEISNIKDHQVFYFNLQKDHVTIESKDKSFIVKFMLEKYPENLQYIPWVEMRGNWKVQLNSLKKEPKAYVMRKSQLTDILSPEQIEEARVHANQEYDTFVNQGGQGVTFGGQPSQASQEQQQVVQTIDQVALKKVDDSSDEDIPEDPVQQPQQVADASQPAAQPQAEVSQKAAQQVADASQPAAQPQAEASQPAAQQHADAEPSPALAQQQEITNFIKVKKSQVRPKFRLGLKKGKLIRKNQN